MKITERRIKRYARAALQAKLWDSQGKSTPVCDLEIGKLYKKRMHSSNRGHEFRIWRINSRANYYGETMRRIHVITEWVIEFDTESELRNFAKMFKDTSMTYEDFIAFRSI